MNLLCGPIKMTILSQGGLQFLLSEIERQLVKAPLACGRFSIAVEGSDTR